MLWFHIFVSSCPPNPDTLSYQLGLVINTCNRSKCSIFLKLNNRGFDFSGIFMIIFEYLWMKRFSNRVLAVYHPSKHRYSNHVCPILMFIFRFSNPSIFSNLKPEEVPEVEPEVEDWASQKNRKISKKTFISQPSGIATTIWRLKTNLQEIYFSQLE